MEITSTPETILTIAADCAKSEWSKTHKPYLLSMLGSHLVKKGVDYKVILGEQRLADFIRSGHEKVKIVSHPTQKAKIGLIPVDEEFEYDVESAPIEKKSNSVQSRGRASHRQYIVSNFLQLVSELDDAEAAQVQIPTNILTKLMRD